MKFKLSIIALLLVSNTLFGFSLFDREEIATLKEKIEKNYNDPSLHIALAQEYDKDFKKSRSISDLEKVFDELQIAYGLKSDDIQIVAMNYQVGAMLVRWKRDEVLLNKLHPLFDFLINANLNVEPISAIRSSTREYNPKNKESAKEHINLFKLALKENNKYFPAYLALASIYNDTNKYDLSIHMANMGIKIEPKFDKFYLLKAQAMMGKIEEKDSNSECRIYNDKENKEIIKILKEAIKLNKNPNDIQAKMELSTTYNRMGKNKLSLFIAKQAYENNPNELTKANLIFNYSEDSQIEKSQKLLEEFSPNNEFIKRQKMYELALIYFMQEEWEKSIELYEDLIDTGKVTNFYSYLYYSFALNAQKKEKDFSILNNLPKKVKMTEWKESLKEYMQNKISDEELINKATDKCKKTEAYFLVGKNKLLNNDIPKARELFKKSIEQKAYSYKEYIAAKYLLTKY